MNVERIRRIASDYAGPSGEHLPELPTAASANHGFRDSRQRWGISAI